MSRRKRVVESSSEGDDSSSSGDGEDEEYQPSKSSSGHNSGPVKKQGKLPSSQQQHSQSSSQGVSSSQASSSQLSSQCAELSQEEFSRCAGLVANYFLAAECKKVPVKRSDLIKVVGKQHTRRLPPIIEEASALLRKIYGYKVEELSSRKNSFILVNTLAPAINSPAGVTLSNGNDETSEDTEEDSLPDLPQRDEGDEKQGLLFVVLTVIFMMGGVVEEVTLHSFLKCLGVYVESRDPHPVFGNCKKLIEEYVRQCYVEVTVLKDMEPPSRQYSWGERAELQVCKKAVLEFVCKVYGGGMRPETWVDHWSKVVGSGTTSSTSSVGSSVEEIIMEVDEQPAPSTSAKASQGTSGRRRKH